MPLLTDVELARLCADLESELVERKASAGDRSGIRRNICAFANDLAGRGRPGLILVGVHDDGSPAALAVTDELLRNLAQIRDDGNILPIPSMSVEKRVLQGGESACPWRARPFRTTAIRLRSSISSRRPSA